MSRPHCPEHGVLLNIFPISEGPWFPSDIRCDINKVVFKDPLLFCMLKLPDVLSVLQPQD